MDIKNEVRDERHLPDPLSDFAHTLKDIERYYKEQDSNNETIGVFAAAAYKALDISYFRSLVEDMFEVRQDISPRYASMILLRGYQADQLEYNPDYPHGFRSEAAWLQAFADVEDDAHRWAILRNGICGQQVQSNVAERYKSIKLLTGLMHDRFGDTPSHLDIGSSVMHGDVKLVYNRMGDNPQVPFDEIDVVDITDTFETTEVTIDRRRTELANMALRRSVNFGAVMGIDITNVDDPVIKQWAKSCSFYPDELLDSKRVDEYDALDKLDPAHERVQFFRGDFSDFDSRAFRAVSPVKEYDIITFSTILYQLEQRERTAMLVNAMNFLSPNGIVVVQDAPDGNFAKKYNYYTQVIDGRDIDAGRQDIFRWENGRCRRVALGMGRLSIDGASFTTSEALEKFA